MYRQPSPTCGSEIQLKTSRAFIPIVKRPMSVYRVIHHPIKTSQAFIPIVKRPMSVYRVIHHPIKTSRAFIPIVKRPMSVYRVIHQPIKTESMPPTMKTMESQLYVFFFFCYVKSSQYNNVD